MHRKLIFYVITEISSDITSSFLVFCKIESWDDNYYKLYTMLSDDPTLYFVSTRSDLGIYIFLEMAGINAIARTLKILRTLKGDYWNKQ